MTGYSTCRVLPSRIFVGLLCFVVCMALAGSLIALDKDSPIPGQVQVQGDKLFLTYSHIMASDP